MLAITLAVVSCPQHVLWTYWAHACGPESVGSQRRAGYVASIAALGNVSADGVDREGPTRASWRPGVG